MISNFIVDIKRERTPTHRAIKQLANATRCNVYHRIIHRPVTIDGIPAEVILLNHPL